ncbi:hypothetical protein V501_06205 [Pseudogymnoascus sp. VKM F-4519 (FW-2642)]|nr:hypothetical protein V501_06205 [Pseudogymnoascus sp. VKM F-4519 (FW-2642)]
MMKRKQGDPAGMDEKRREEAFGVGCCMAGEGEGVVIVIVIVNGVVDSRVTREAEDGEVDDAAGSFVRSQVSDVDCGWGQVRSVQGQVSTGLLALLLLYWMEYTQDARRSNQDAATKTQHLILDSRDSPQDDEKAGRPREKVRVNVVECSRPGLPRRGGEIVAHWFRLALDWLQNGLHWHPTISLTNEANRRQADDVPLEGLLSMRYAKWSVFGQICDEGEAQRPGGVWGGGGGEGEGRHEGEPGACRSSAAVAEPLSPVANGDRHRPQRERGGEGTEDGGRDEVWWEKRTPGSQIGTPRSGVTMQEHIARGERGGGEGKRRDTIRQDQTKTRQDMAESGNRARSAITQSSPRAWEVMGLPRTQREPTRRWQVCTGAERDSHSGGDSGGGGGGGGGDGDGDDEAEGRGEGRVHYSYLLYGGQHDRSSGPAAAHESGEEWRVNVINRW